MNQIIDIAFTGKSQASALDIQSKKETEFLERYARYVVKDECQGFLTDSYVHMQHVLDPKRVSHLNLIEHKKQNIHNPNIDCHVFFALRAVRFSMFSSFYDKVLEQFNVYNREDFARSVRTVAQTKTTQQKKQLFYKYQPSSFNDTVESQSQVNCYELYSNKLAQQQETMSPGDMVIIDSKVKCTSLRGKELIHDIKRLVDYLFKASRHQHQIIDSEYLPYLQELKTPMITIILFYNGDVNFDFERYLKLNNITINNVNYLVRLKVYYVSKQALFSHFRERNNQQKIDCINDKVVTFYDMNRKKFQRTATVKEIEKIKEDQHKSKENELKFMKHRKLITMLVAAGVLIIGSLLIYSKKIPLQRVKTVKI